MKKNKKYYVTLVIGIIPFVINLIYTIKMVTNRGYFQLFDFERIYGIEAYLSLFTINLIFYSPIFLIAIILIIVSIYKIIKKRKEK